jgi:ribosome-binding ATPase YchF (GTP1/OBG family)
VSHAASSTLPGAGDEQDQRFTEDINAQRNQSQDHQKHTDECVRQGPGALDTLSLAGLCEEGDKHVGEGALGQQFTEHIRHTEGHKKSIRCSTRTKYAGKDHVSEQSG